MASPVTIPETITVHLGAPSSNAPNITVPFDEYIKNVASSEIYPTWPEEAIRANVLAQTSYVLNRVFTEWYRAQGYDFDITNDTRYDQSYVPGRDIFENISTIVDDQFNDYLTRGDTIEPLFAQYCDGSRTLCPGGLSQWGTVGLAEQGLDARQIIESFYGDNINIVQDAPVSPNLGGSWPGFSLRLGNVGEEVRTIQTRLNRISTNFPNIPKIDPVSGVFDADTERAVRAFQSQFNLGVDGVVGKATWYRIASIYNNVKRLSELDSEGLLLGDVSREYPSELREGNRGPGVQVLQYFLAVVGAFYEELPILTAADVDGIFGPKTRDAVLAYQRFLNLPETGVVDRATWNALVSTYQAVLRARPPSEWLQNASGFPSIFLVEGMRGEEVRRAQELINILARVYPDVPSVTADGVFGPATQNAVIAVQTRVGIPQTGAIGPLTWEALSQLASDILAGSQTAPEQFPGYTVGEGAGA